MLKNFLQFQINHRFGQDYSLTFKVLTINNFYNSDNKNNIWF